MKYALAMLLLALPALAQGAGDPAAAANAFYTVYQTQVRQGGGIPDATGRLRYSAVLTPRLNQQIADAARAQARLTAKVKNAVPPMLEGDIFSFAVRRGRDRLEGGRLHSVQDKTARCPVALNYTPPSVPGRKAREKPANWNDTILAGEHAPAGWKVDDVIYDAGFAVRQYRQTQQHAGDGGGSQSLIALAKTVTICRFPAY